jgi:hypothetical protein
MAKVGILRKIYLEIVKAIGVKKPFIRARSLSSGFYVENKGSDDLEIIISWQTTRFVFFSNPEKQPPVSPAIPLSP